MATPPRYPLVTLTADLNVSRFDCGPRPGSADINEYLKTRALVEQQAGLTSVHVAIDSRAESSGEIAGFFTLSPLSVPISAAVLAIIGVRNVPYRAVGGYLLGRLGVGAPYQGQQLGPALVAAAIKLAHTAQRQAGGAFLAVDPKNDRLLAWYEQLDFGFTRLNHTDERNRRMVLRLLK